MREVHAGDFETPGMRKVVHDGFKVELDLSSQVLAVKAPIDLDYAFELDAEPGSAEAPLSATLGPIDSTGLMSAAVLAQKAKIFDDGLYAAVEVATQEGIGRHAGKAALLASLCHSLAGSDPAAAGTAPELLLGAARLGQVPIKDIPHALESRTQHVVEAFLADEVRSKPVGFYSWSQQLENIFRQDRMLQGEIDAAGVKSVASALRADPSSRATYERHLRLVSRLTNPFAHPDLLSLLEANDHGHASVDETDARFFPPSVAYETQIMKKLYGDRPIPDGFVLVDEMIHRIRAGTLDLEPRPESGWYEYQTWALEALVIPEQMPEGGRLKLDAEYRKLLRELFEGLLTLTRETHIKQLEIPTLGAAFRGGKVSLPIVPALSAEPLATFYLRRALGYRYVQGVLEDAFGPGELEKLRRLTEAGPVPMSLAEELSEMEAIFLGAHVSVSRELGLSPESAAGSDSVAAGAAKRFAAWARELESDHDLRQDLRAMVPVFYDLQRQKTKVWVFLGWSRRPINVSFEQPPEATFLDLEGEPLRDPPRILWGGLHATLPYPVTAELYVDRILTRDEFRKLCDSCGTRLEILRRLGASASPA